MKRVFIICAAALTMLCGCGKIHTEIHNLEYRVEKTENKLDDLVSKVEALQKLADAAAQNVYIESVTAVDGGFKVVFTDGKSFTVVSGEDSKVDYTEDSQYYYFDFGDGNTVAVAKSNALAIKLETTEVELAPSKAVEIPFTIVGADETTVVLVEDCAYNVKVGESSITVSAEKVIPGYFIVKAVRNSDGAVSAIAVSVAKAEIEDVTFELEVVDITHNGAIVNVTPSNNYVYYYVSVEKSDYVSQFETAEELIEADIDYFYERYGQNYSQYGFSSFEDLFLNGLCLQGPQAYDGALDYLDAETDYVAYAWAIDEDFNVVSSEVAMEAFTTLEAPKPAGDYIGVALWHDVFAADIYGIDGEQFNLDFPVDVYEKDGLYTFDSPYDYVNIANWFGITPEELEPYHGNYRSALIKIDASDPKEVHFELQDLGCCLNADDGWLSGGAEYDDEVISTGTLVDGVITFGEMTGALSKYQAGYPVFSVNEGNTFMITLPDPASKAAKLNTSAATTIRLVRRGLGNTLSAKVSR